MCIVLSGTEPIQRVLLARENSISRDSFGKHQEFEVSQRYIVTVGTLSTHVQKTYTYANVRAQSNWQRRM